MKRIFSTIALILLLIIGYMVSLKLTSTQSVQMIQKTNKILTTTSFKQIQEYVLAHGDRKTYCNRYNDNPHVALNNMDIYLDPDDWHNINCNPKLSDFNTMVIYSQKNQQYHSVKIDETKLIIEKTTTPEELEKLFKEALLEIEAK